MGWGNVIGGITSLIGGSQGRSAARDQQRAAEQGLEFQRGVYRDAQGNLAPYMGAGQQGLNGLSALMGGDYSGFMNSPDFLASQKAGIYANDHSAAARGNVFSGGHQVDLNQKMQDHATGYLNNYRGFLGGMAQMGQQSAMGLGQLGQSAAGNMMQGYQNVGNAQAAGRGATAGMWGGVLGGLANGVGGWGGQQSAYGGGSSAGSFGLPAPVDPYANTNWGR